MPRRDTLARNKGGRPTVYSNGLADLICEAVANGNHLTTACHLAGVGQSTLYSWIQKGNAYEEALATGKETKREHAVFVEFRDKLLHARARSEDWAVSVIRQDAEGGFVTSEEPVVDEKGQVQYDEDGKVLWKRTMTSPNGRLALAYLGRMSPEKWGEKGRVEITGADGVPLMPGAGGQAAGVAVEAESDPEVRALLQRMAKVAGRREPGWDHFTGDLPGSEPEDVHEAELVEEDEDG